MPCDSPGTGPVAVETLFVSSSSRVAGSSPSSSSWCVGTPKRKTVRAPPLYAFLTHSLSLAYPSNRCLCVRARRHHPVVVVVATQGYKTVRPRNRPRAKRRVDGAKIFNASQPAATLKLKLPSRISQPTAAEKSKAKIAIDSSSSVVLSVC